MLALRDTIADAAPLADGKSLSESPLPERRQKAAIISRAEKSRLEPNSDGGRLGQPPSRCVLYPADIRARHIKADFPFHTRNYLRVVVQHYYELNLDDIHNALAAEGIYQSGRARRAGSPRAGVQAPVPLLMLDLTARLAALAGMSSDDPRIPSLFPESYADWVPFVRGFAGRGSALHLVRVRYRGAVRTLVVPRRLPSAIREQQLRQYGSWLEPPKSSVGMGITGEEASPLVQQLIKGSREDTAAAFSAPASGSHPSCHVASAQAHFPALSICTRPPLPTSPGTLAILP
ncbi:hypothetical protein MKEN_00384700 [Mycena kentingensis (nom. inval.)]|nr:hypothetical protein MKEN_00384700 [Mycena kentingensis (nom. inval.)]